MKFYKYNIEKTIFRYYLQYFEILLICVKLAHFNGIFLQYF